MRPVAGPRRSCWPPRAAPRTPTPPTRLAGTGSRCRGSRPEVTSTQRRSNEPCPGSRRQPTSWPKPTPSSPRSTRARCSRHSIGLMQEAKDEIHARSEQATTAADLARLLPPMLGADGARTYLLVTLSPSDPRGSGGYPGVYGLLHVDGQQALAVATWRRRREIPKVPPVAGPADAKKAWGWAGHRPDLLGHDLHARLPHGGRIHEGHLGGRRREARRRRDRGRPCADGLALEVVGPVDTPAWPETITADNVQQIVGADVYKTTSQEQSDAWEVGIGASLWDAVLTRPWPVQAMATAMSSAVDGGHLQVWSTRPGRAGSAGTARRDRSVRRTDRRRPAGDLNGFTANRAGYFATTDVQVARHGTDDEGQPDDHGHRRPYRTAAPDGPPSILLGHRSGATWAGSRSGTFGTDLTCICRRRAPSTSFQVNGRRDAVRVGRTRGPRGELAAADRAG